MTRLSASFSATLRVHLQDCPGAFADLARVIADTGASLEAIDLVRAWSPPPSPTRQSATESHAAARDAALLKV